MRLNKFLKIVLCILYVPLLAFFVTRFDYINESVYFPFSFITNPFIPDNAGIGAGILLGFYYISCVGLIIISSLVLAFREKKFVWIIISFIIVLLPVIAVNIPDKYDLEKQNEEQQLVKLLENTQLTFLDVRYIQEPVGYNNELLEVAYMRLKLHNLSTDRTEYSVVVFPRNEQSGFHESQVHLQFRERNWYYTNLYQGQQERLMEEGIFEVRNQLLPYNLEAPKVVSEIAVRLLHTESWSIVKNFRTATLRQNETKSFEIYERLR